MKTKVTQLINANGNAAANQFVLTDDKKQTFQSYKTTICHYYFGTRKIVLDTAALDYSMTTSKHLFIFLGMNRKEIEAAIKDRSIKVRNLNC